MDQIGPKQGANHIRRGSMLFLGANQAVPGRFRGKIQG